MTGLFARRMHTLRVRVVILFVAGLMAAGAGFYALLLSFTHQWLGQELDVRTRTMAHGMARQVAAPLMIGSQVDLRSEVLRAARDPDVAGAALYRADGKEIARSVNEPGLWPPFTPPPPDSSEAREFRVVTHRISDLEVRELVVPVWHAPRRLGLPAAEAREVFGEVGGRAARKDPKLLGWVRLVISTERLEVAVATQAQLGFMLLLVEFALAVLASFLMLRIVVRPLREASDLAKDIAAGHLERRLPVRGDDELGALAESLNTMALTLAETQKRERSEAAALRDAADAVVAIAHGVRAGHNPRRVFEVVAAQVRRVTGCEGVALAMPARDPPELIFEHFDPLIGWGGIQQGRALDPELANQFTSPDSTLFRLALDAPRDRLSLDLARAGYRSALLVPLDLEDGVPALLLLAAREDGAFTPSEVRVVAGLATHLSSAIRADVLQRRLEQAFQELETTRDQLVRNEKLRATGELASGVAHDFNNVLGAVLGRIQLLRRQAAARALSTDELLDSLAVMELASRDGAETVRRLQQFSRGDEPTATGRADLGEALRAAADFTCPRWRDEAESEGRQITVQIQTTGNLVVEARASELREVFTNLILNAVDALPQGGWIRLSALARDGRAVALVEDNGVGMTEEVQRRIYDPFFTTKGAQGTGLGMSVVYGIVQRLGGHLSLHSRPGGGTCIELSVPASKGEVEAETPPSLVVMPASPHVALDVLVVDDDAPVRQLVVDILQALGHSPTDFESAESALKSFVPGRHQLAITDLGMPGMNGWDLARELRRRDPDLAIAFVTGWGAEVSLAAVQDAGGDVVVAKPFTIEDIVGLTQLVPRRRAERNAA
ncbi:MAG TPA: ATP-binding protein [Candidatus Limnocylindria bacterium]|nr:ATP-binding protein [Candidatus Limnocylindria bacterium]